MPIIPYHLQKVNKHLKIFTIISLFALLAVQVIDLYKTVKQRKA